MGATKNVGVGKETNTYHDGKSGGGPQKATVKKVTGSGSTKGGGINRSTQGKSS